MERPTGFVTKGQHWAVISNLPNLLSLFRILAIPFILLLLSFSTPVWSFWSAVLYSIASLTDILDGYIARQKKSETALGRLLDPMADKLLINSAFIMLIPLDRISAWIVILIVGREIAITGLRAIASVEGVIISPSFLGKTKTVLQSIALLSLILHFKYLGVDFHSLGTLILWVALLFTLWSGGDYFFKYLRGHQKEKNSE